MRIVRCKAEQARAELFDQLPDGLVRKGTEAQSLARNLGGPAFARGGTARGAFDEVELVEPAGHPGRTVFHGDATQAVVPLEDAVEDHRAEKHLDAVVHPDQPDDGAGCIATDGDLRAIVVVKARADRVVVAVDRNVHHEGHVGGSEPGPHGIEVRMGKGAGVRVRFVGIDHQRRDAVGERFV